MKRFKAAIIALVFPGFIASAAVAAEISVIVEAGNPLVQNSASATSGVIARNVVSQANSTGGSARARAFASFGSLGAYAISFTNTGAGGSNGRSHAIWSDMITINAPGFAGTPGFLNFSMTVHGSLNASTGDRFVGSGSAGYSLAISFDNDTTSFFGSQSPNAPPSGSLLPLNVSMANQPFTFGVPFSLLVDLGATASSGCDGSCGQAIGTADFYNTLNWGGISEVRDNSGSSVTNFTLSSDSGTDWTHPVPEPTSLVLIIVGCFEILTLRRR